MSGNVWEWCLNKYFNPKDMAVDASTASRVLRGGSWFDFQDLIPSATRDLTLPDSRLSGNGFRVVLVGDCALPCAQLS